MSPNPQAVVLPQDVFAALAGGACFMVVLLAGLLLWSRWQLWRARARLAEAEERVTW